MPDQVLVFDISASYGHFKVIYATTSALTYPIPSKTAIYGMVGNIIGLSNNDNEYLKFFKEGECKIALQVLNPISTQRFHINWSATPGAINGRKPTLVEHVSNPHYRVFFTHTNEDIYKSLKTNLQNHTSVYTPCMGLANLLANFQFRGEYEYVEKNEDVVDIHSIIPMSSFIEFDGMADRDNFITSINQYAMEMTHDRDVTQREEILLDRQGYSIPAKVKTYQQLKNTDKPTNIILH